MRSIAADTGLVVAVKRRVGVALAAVALAGGAVGAIVLHGGGGGGAVPVAVTGVTGVPAIIPMPPATRKGELRCGALWAETMALGGHDGFGQTLYREALAGLDRGSPPILHVALRPDRGGWCRALVQMSAASTPPAATKALDCEFNRDADGCGGIRPLPDQDSRQWIWFELEADGSLS